MEKIFFSNIKWSEAEESIDSHYDYETAEYICSKLLWDFGNIPCEYRGYCEKAWVTDINGKIIFEDEYEKRFRPSYLIEKPR